MTDSLAFPRTASRGIVGDRQLLAVQTFDIARLTNHAVLVLPGTFVAVSGQGPKGDSNGSGKTSFLAAVTILLGDPQWRFDTHGGKSAAGVLFRPDSAGVDPTHQIRSATDGYIVGVFAEPDNPRDSAVTVWVKLSTSAPYVQARWAAGLHAASDGERDLQADEIWQRVKGSGTVSARKMAEILYGDAPRCLSYLDTPLRPAVPSLLSQQMTEMAPRDIGDSLIALSGSKGHLDEEREQRGTVLTQRRERDDSLARLAEQHEREQAELDGIAGRDAARSELASALENWRVYGAQRYLTALEQDRDLAESIGNLQERINDAAGLTAELTATLEDLEARTDLTTEEDKARTARDLAKEARSALELERAAKVARQTDLEAEAVKLTAKIDGWDGRSPDETEQDLAAARARHAEVTVSLRTAEGQVAAAREALTRAEEGRSGEAGAIIDALSSQNMSGTALFDVVELSDDARVEWESRLWPWRDAVIVDWESRAAARRALADIPGAHLIYTDGGTEVNYPGVRCRLPINSFFQQIQQRYEPGSDPDHVLDAALPASINGGFPEAITGLESVVYRMRRKIDEAERHRDTLRTEVELTEASVEIAHDHHQAAQAVVRLHTVHGKAEELGRAIGELDGKIGTAIGEESLRNTTWEKAFSLLTGHRGQVELCQAKVATQRREEGRLRDRLTAKRKERVDLAVEYWRAMWGADEQQAVGLLAEQPETAQLPAERVRARAIEQLARATTQFGIDESDPAGLPADLREAAERREVLAADRSGKPPTMALDKIAFPLRTRLDGQAEADQVRTTRIEAQRTERARVHEALETRLADSEVRLRVVQDMIAQRVEGILRRVGAAFNQLDEDRGGCGAELLFDNDRPIGPGEWIWEVTPRWKRSGSGPFVPYREVANGAQVKVYAVQLVLAALLADADTHGRVLVLDELGNSLGEVNRKDVLGALKRVAEQQNVTILGTCQDSVVADASDVCGELMWFAHTSTANAYNHPTRVWAFDANGDRAALTAGWLRSGRRVD